MVLTHRGLNKMANILQTTYSTAFCWTKSFIFYSILNQFSLKFVTECPIDNRGMVQYKDTILPV